MTRVTNFGIERIHFTDHSLNSPLAISSMVDTASLPQERLRRENNQRLTLLANRLSTQHMENLGRCRGLTYFHVHFGTQLHEAFNPRLKSVQALPLVTMRQQQNGSRRRGPILVSPEAMN